jgi:hypothetical protein
MNPREFQQLAKKLVSETSPAHLRTAISRAYYAAYNIAADVLREMGFHVPRSAYGHGDVQRWLGNCGDREVEAVGSQLAGLHSKRLRADYDLDKTDVERPKTAQAVVKQADKMIKVLESCRTGQKREQVIQAIREWKRKTTKKA